MSVERLVEVELTGAEEVSAQIPLASKGRNETPRPPTAVIQAIKEGEKFKELFELRGTKPNFRRVVQRTINPQVTDRDSWNEFAGTLDYFLGDFPAISQKLDRAVLGELYIASRRAFIRSLYDFQRNYFKEDIKSELRENKLKALEKVRDKSSRAFLASFSEEVFDKVVFQDRIPQVKL